MPQQSGSESLLRPFNRRRFLKTAGSAAILPAVLRSAAAQTSTTSPNNRINLGVIGMGWQGPGNTEAFLTLSDCQVVAACDIDANHLQAAVKKINDAYGNEDCKGYHDYRELLARDDIDAVMIAVPDHWHEIVATEAARRKKDIYGEKPLAHTIAEQQSIVRAVQENQIIWQMGSWQRSVPMFHKAAEIVRNGLIGEVTHVEVGLPGGNSDFDDVGKEALAKLAAAGQNVASLEQIVSGTPAWNIARHRSSQGTGLRDVDRAVEDGAVHQGPFAQILALELQHRRRRASGLDRPPLRYCPLGPRFRPHRSVGGRRQWRTSAAQRGVEHRTEIPVRAEVSARRHHDDCRRLSRHQDGREMDRHRGLGVGRSRADSTPRIQRGSKANTCRGNCAR